MPIPSFASLTKGKARFPNLSSCPPIARFGTKEQRQRWLPGVAKGELRFCLGITEPDAGSDVANIQTTAQRVGDHYVVNGAKKWITNGIWADYCTAAVRTGPPNSGHGGISLLVVPLKVKGVNTRRMFNTGVNASGMKCCSLPSRSSPPFWLYTRLVCFAAILDTHFTLLSRLDFHLLRRRPRTGRELDWN